ncbi:hypothetical protein BWZ22_02495 [Seonamhaeicola sp. S2-3]|uniref:hypothetical protein n=1 Tax=Seonamhaeicola sp. S2-3 TaxID=1936081 RepID=UPI000972D8FF|nr:hypothetical protein [Seonamhaeicola sp. S2-3]APY10171.1 hypothetical protein BWZ22_02495 [Seonamhaeicola sp. S2-3]
MGRIKAKTHLEKLGFSEKDKKDSKHDIIQTWAYENIEKVISETTMSKNPHPFKIITNKWEHQMMYVNGNYKMIVGYIDILVRIQGKFYFNDSDKYEDYTKNVFIEVKTQIPSLGELIRQMRAYQAYDDRFTDYIVISPDDRHKKILNEQGFWFYKYKDPNLLF